MSEKKDYRIEAVVTGNLVIHIEAESEGDAIAQAEASIEGGEALISWGHEGSGMVAFTMPGTDIQAFEE